MPPSFATSASLLIALQLGSRLFTFGLNQALLRFVSPQAFGTAAIQFELLSSTILFLSREGFRNALLRAWSETQPKEGQRVPSNVSNLAILPSIIGLPVSLIASWLYYQSCSFETKSQSHFSTAVLIYGLASCIELASEPYYVRSMGELKTQIRVQAEGAGIIMKTAVTFMAIQVGLHLSAEDGYFALLSFAAGQIAYALVVLGTYVKSFGLRPLMLRVQGGSLSFHPKYMKLAMSMSFQSIFKHLLTEGDKFLISQLSPLEDQGGYALANNYGSLIARILFQPVEEMSRVFFSRTLAHVAPENLGGEQASTNADDKGALQLSADTLTSILAAQIGASTIICTFGPPLLPLALRIVLPTRYLATSAPQLLQAWLWYIPILAINGVLEAFMASVATTKDIHRQSRWMASFSLAFALAAAAFYRLGFQDVSLIYANMVNLASRIIFANHFIKRFFRDREAESFVHWSSSFPRATFIAASLLARGSLYLAKPKGTEGKTRITLTDLMKVDVMLYTFIAASLASVCAGLWWYQTGRRLVLPTRKATSAS